MEHPQAIITGATSGIGAAFARQLAAQGYDLVLAGRRAERLNALANELQQKYAITAEVLVSDLAQPGGIAAVEKCIDASPRLALLINNAGFGVPGHFTEIEIETQADMIQVHIMAVVRLTHRALQGMLARRHGAIINVSSLAAFIPPSMGSSIYGFTKSFLNAFSEGLRTDLRGSGVRIQVLCPGFTYTEFHDRPGFENFKRSSLPRIAWMTADQVAATSLKALQKDRLVCIPGLANQVVAAFARNGLVRWMIAPVMKLRPQPRVISQG
jgi:hypothetical protein